MGTKRGRRLEQRRPHHTYLASAANNQSGSLKGASLLRAVDPESDLFEIRLLSVSNNSFAFCRIHKRSDSGEQIGWTERSQRFSSRDVASDENLRIVASKFGHTTNQFSLSLPFANGLSLDSLVTESCGGCIGISVQQVTNRDDVDLRQMFRRLRTN